MQTQIPPPRYKRRFQAHFRIGKDWEAAWGLSWGPPHYLDLYRGITLPRRPNYSVTPDPYADNWARPDAVFGSGLIQSIPDSTILANKNANSTAKQLLGISGRENRSGNDGAITRFGWKAQNQSLLIFSGEAYNNVEMGITNELFTQERSETPGCLFNALPENTTDETAVSPTGAASDVLLFTEFMRMLAPPTPAPDTPSIANGRNLFSVVGCAFCHAPRLETGRSATAALSNKPVNLYSDLLLHDMGTGLADEVQQGAASGSEFRTAPLWGLGQRIFFLHDGRTKDLLEAIRAHSSSGSEASRVVGIFNLLPDAQKQQILDFLRSL